MASDDADGQTVLFGGVDASRTYLSDTWLWTGSTWVEDSPTTGPPPEDGATMAYDPDLSAVVLFGGSLSTGSSTNATWSWNGSTWTQLVPDVNPSARNDVGLAYDAATSQFVLFGGGGSGSVLADTWVLVPNATGPPPTIQSVTPAWAPFTGGTSVRISGAFGANPYVHLRGPCLTLGCFVIFDEEAAVTSANSTTIIVTVPSISLYEVGELDGPAVLEVDTATGTATTGFTYVVPEIGELVSYNGLPPPNGPYASCVAEAVQSGNHRVVLSAGHCIKGATDFAFAPGYFGSFPCHGPGGSSSFFCPSATPYGIWCAETRASGGASPDPECGTTTSRSTAVVSPQCCATQYSDFGFIDMASSTQGCPTGVSLSLGACLGGGLAIPWIPGGSPGSASSQDWNIFGYLNGYLDTCNAFPIADNGNYSAGWLFIGQSICPWVTHGDSGGPWINGQNGAFYGIGAVNKGLGTVNNVGGVFGSYMGLDALVLWQSVQSINTSTPMQRTRPPSARRPVVHLRKH